MLMHIFCGIIVVKNFHFVLILAPLLTKAIDFLLPPFFCFQGASNYLTQPNPTTIFWNYKKYFAK